MLALATVVALLAAEPTAPLLCPDGSVPLFACSVRGPKQPVRALCARSTPDGFDQLAAVQTGASGMRVSWSTPVVNAHVESWSSGAMHGVTVLVALPSSVVVIDVQPDSPVVWLEQQTTGARPGLQRFECSELLELSTWQMESLPFTTTSTQTEGHLLHGLTDRWTVVEDPKFEAASALATCVEPKPATSGGVRVRVLEVFKAGKPLHECHAYLAGRHIAGTPAVFLDAPVGKCLAVVDCGADGVFQQALTLGNSAGVTTLR